MGGNDEEAEEGDGMAGVGGVLNLLPAGKVGVGCEASLGTGPLSPMECGRSAVRWESWKLSVMDPCDLDGCDGAS